MSEKTTKTPPFDWSQVMAIGLGILQLPPWQFWQMTLPELSAALYGMTGQPLASYSPLTQGDLSALMAQFPDL